MTSDVLTVTLAVPTDVYEELRPQYDVDGNLIEDEDAFWSPDDDILAALQDIVVNTGENLGVSVVPLFRPLPSNDNDGADLALTSDVIFSYKPTTECLSSLCKTGMSRLDHSVIFGHPEEHAPHITVPVRKLLYSLNIPLDRLFLQPISNHCLNRDQITETVKRALAFAAESPFRRPQS